MNILNAISPDGKVRSVGLSVTVKKGLSP